MSIRKELFGVLSDGRPVHSYILRTRSGFEAKILDYGGAVAELRVPDRNGDFSDIVCGYDSPVGYEKDSAYQGMLVGRYANRIGGAGFLLDGIEYHLDKNDGGNTLHGGNSGLSHKIWSVELPGGDEPLLSLSVLSPDGEGGFPGNLAVKVVYKLTESGSLEIHYSASTDKKTIVNLTNHSYFNLGGYASGSVLGHLLKLDADSFLPTDGELIPTGEVRPVNGTPFDFRAEKPIGRDFDISYEPIRLASGFDHCLNFTGGEARTPKHRITLTDPVSGRVMYVLTTQPCVQLYTANFMTSSRFPLKGGLPQRAGNAVCLETQKMPDSCNHSGFTDVILAPGERFSSTTIYKFDTL